MEKYTKPFAAAWRGRAYFAIGIFFWVIYSLVVIPQATPDTPWYQVLLYKALGSLDKISYAVLVAGLAYVILSDVIDYVWNTSLKSEFASIKDHTGGILQEGLFRFTSGLNVLTYEAVKVWVEGSTGTSVQKRTLGASALKTSFGPPDNIKDALIDYLSEEVMDVWATEDSQIWDNFQSSVVLRRSNAVLEHFEWEETKSYDIIFRKKGMKIPFMLETSLRIDRINLQQALNNMKYQIKIDGKIVMDFASWWNKNSAKVNFNDNFDVQSEGYWVKYNGTWIGFEFSRDYDVDTDRVAVSIYENSYVSDQDRCYAIAVRHPTKKIQASLAIESQDWAVKTPVTSANLYRYRERGVSIETPHTRRSQVSVTQWTLPGLAVLIEWTPTT